MNLLELYYSHLDAKENETAAFQAIKGEGTDAQWRAYFDAQEKARVARNRLLVETQKDALSMIKNKNIRSNLTDFFQSAIQRDGEARDKAIMKACELAVLAEIAH